LLSLLPTILLLVGKVNFTNLSRYSEYSERPYRRHYTQAFPFVGLNSLMIPDDRMKPRIQIGSMDCSFIGKGFYSKQKFVDGVVEFEVVSKLRADANLRYLYEGQQKPRGAKRKYDGKVQFADLRRFQFVEQLEPHLQLYSAVVWHVSLKRRIRVACLVNTRQSGKTGYVLLYSTDLSLDAKWLVEYYQARFQIEFMFRDAKQFTGLCDCQARDAKKLEFHFNACLSALNLAKYEMRLQQEHKNGEPTVEPFSMASYKCRALNDHLLERFGSASG